MSSDETGCDRTMKGDAGRCIPMQIAAGHGSRSSCVHRLVLTMRLESLSPRQCFVPSGTITQRQERLKLKWAGRILCTHWCLRSGYCQRSRQYALYMVWRLRILSARSARLLAARSTCGALLQEHSTPRVRPVCRLHVSFGLGRQESVLCRIHYKQQVQY